MSDVLLSGSEQTALRQVLSAELVAGRPLPPTDVLARLAALVACDSIVATVSDSQGFVVGKVVLPQGRTMSSHASRWDRPPRIGVVHWVDVPGYAERLRAEGLSDSLALGFRSGRGRVVRVWWDRWTGGFSDRDVALLTMVAPAVQRLVGDTAPAGLPSALTVQERRTLALMAAGASNVEIAERMGVATSTVRKHLEHAYRKLGVTNRLAAAVALRGELLGSHELDHP